MSSVTYHDITATVAGHDLAVTDATLTLDATWAPYARLELTCSVPDEATLALLDPRTGARITGTLTMDWVDAARPSTSRPFDLSLRTRRVDHAAGTVQLSATSDEALLMDRALTDTAPFGWPSLDLRELSEMIVSQYTGGTVQEGEETGTVSAAAIYQAPGQSAWDFLEPLIQSGGLRLWCDEQRRWWLNYSVYTKPGLVSLSAAVNLTALQDNIDRNEWYDSVVVTYRWDGTDTHDAAAVTYGTGAAVPRRTLHLTYDAPYPGPGAAADLLDRLTTRGRADQLAAVSDYTIEPGREVSISYLDGSNVAGYVQAVAWAYPSAEMSITTRGLTRASANSWFSEAEGDSWLDLPVGVEWTDRLAWVDEPRRDSWTDLAAGISWLADA